MPTLSLPVPPVTGMRFGSDSIGYMFLGEVALGREHHITEDQPNLQQSPPGFDSVIARGYTEPGECLKLDRPEDRGRAEGPRFFQGGGAMERSGREIVSSLKSLTVSTNTC